MTDEEQIRNSCCQIRRHRWSVMAGTLLMLILLLSDSTLTAQEFGQIAGVVRDAATNAALPGASVAIVGLDFGVTTGSEGMFTFSQVPVGIYSLTVSAAGYQLFTKTNVQVEANTTTTLSLQIGPTVDIPALNAVYACIDTCIVIRGMGSAPDKLRIRVSLCNESDVEYADVLARIPANTIRFCGQADSTYLATGVVKEAVFYGTLGVHSCADPQPDCHNGLPFISREFEFEISGLGPLGGEECLLFDVNILETEQGPNKCDITTPSSGFIRTCYNLDIPPAILSIAPVKETPMKWLFFLGGLIIGFLIGISIRIKKKSS